MPPKEVQGCGETLRSPARMPRITICRIIAAIPVMHAFAAAVINVSRRDHKTWVAFLSLCCAFNSTGPVASPKQYLFRALRLLGLAVGEVRLGYCLGSITLIMENQMGKKMENEMDSEIIQGLYWGNIG